MITPSDMWVYSVGKAPTGVQSDGVNLKPLLWSDDTTYTSYALRPIAPAPEFSAIALPALMMVFGVTLLIIGRRERLPTLKALISFFTVTFEKS